MEVDYPEELKSRGGLQEWLNYRSLTRPRPAWVSKECPAYLHMKLVASGLGPERRVRLGVRREGLEGEEAAALEAFLERQYADLFLQTDGDSGAVYLHIDKEVLAEGFHQLVFTIEELTCTRPSEMKRVELVFIDEKDNLRKNIIKNTAQLFHGSSAASSGGSPNNNGEIPKEISTQLAVVSNEASLRPTIVQFSKNDISVAIEYLWQSARGFSSVVTEGEGDKLLVQQFEVAMSRHPDLRPADDWIERLRAMDHSSVAEAGPPLLEITCKYLGLASDPLLVARHPAYGIFVQIMARLHHDCFADDLLFCESISAQVARALSTHALMTLLKALTKDAVINRRHIRNREHWLCLMACCRVATHKLHALHHSRSPQPLRKALADQLSLVAKMKPLECAWEGVTHMGLDGILASLDPGTVVLKLQQLLQRTEVDVTAIQRCKAGPWKKPPAEVDPGVTSSISKRGEAEHGDSDIDFITACIAHLFRSCDARSVWANEVLPSSAQWVLSRLRSLVCSMLLVMFSASNSSESSQILLQMDGVRSLLCAALQSPSSTSLYASETRKLAVRIAEVEVCGGMEKLVAFQLMRFFHGAVKTKDGEEGESLLWTWVISGEMPDLAVKGLCVKLARFVRQLGVASSMGRPFKQITQEICNLAVETNFPWASPSWTGIFHCLVELSLSDYYGVQLLHTIINIYTNDAKNPSPRIQGSYETPLCVSTLISLVLEASLRLKSGISGGGSQTSHDDLVRCITSLLAVEADRAVVEAEVLIAFFHARSEGGEAANRLDHILVRLEESEECKALCSKLLLLRTLEGIGEDFHISMEAVKLLLGPLSAIYSPYLTDSRLGHVRDFLPSIATLQKLLRCGLSVLHRLNAQSVTAVLTRLNLHLFLLTLLVEVSNSVTSTADTTWEASIDQQLLSAVAALVNAYQVLFNSTDASNLHLRHRLLASAAERTADTLKLVDQSRLSQPALERVRKVWAALESSYGDRPAVVRAVMEKERQLGLRRSRYCVLQVSTLCGNLVSMCPAELYTSCVELSDKIEQGGLVKLKMANCCIPCSKGESSFEELKGNWTQLLPVHDIAGESVCYALLGDGSKVLRVSWERLRRKESAIKEHLIPTEVEGGEIRSVVVKTEDALLEECCQRIHLLRTAVDHPIWSAKVLRTHETSAKQILVQFIGRELEDVLTPQVSGSGAVGLRTALGYKGSTTLHAAGRDLAGLVRLALDMYLANADQPADSYRRERLKVLALSLEALTGDETD